MIYLDTHVVVWLYTGAAESLPSVARQKLDGHDVLISPMVMLELHYLHQIGRSNVPAELMAQALSRDIGLRVCDLPFAEVVQTALTQDWTRDPFDRLITSAAICRAVPLITKDTTIRANYTRAVWDTALPENSTS
jgi:PIN domain nuclease of toxin-antitoxin system